MAQEAKFCPECGQSLSVPNPPFCSQCGTRLAGQINPASEETPIPSRPPRTEPHVESVRRCMYCQEIMTDSDISDRSNVYGLKCGHCGEWNHPRRNNPRLDNPRRTNSGYVPDRPIELRHDSRFMGMDLGIGLMTGCLGTIAVIVIVLYLFFKLSWWQYLF